jgi:hypothetical protein
LVSRKTKGQLTLPTIGISLALLFVPANSPACGCGPTSRFVVAHGTSPNGASWQIKVDERPGSVTFPRYAQFHFSAGPAGESNGLGYFSSMPLPIFPAFVFHAVSGNGVYPDLEGDVSGYARRRAVRLVARMSAGTPIEIETQRPPANLSKRFPWLRGLVFFDQFYPADVEPVAITAYGRDGRLLSRQPM